MLCAKFFLFFMVHEYEIDYGGEMKQTTTMTMEVTNNHRELNIKNLN